MKLTKEEKAMIKAYVVWMKSTGREPWEYDISNFLEIKNTEKRWLVEEFITQLEK